MSRLPPDGLVAPRPALGRAGGRRPAALVAVLVCSLAVALAGCAPTVPTAPAPIAASGGPGPRTSAAIGIPTPSASPASSAEPTPAASTMASAGPDLLLLSTESGVATLSLVRLSGDVVTVPLPDPSVAAVAPIAGGQLMALLRDGRAFAAQRGPAGLAAASGWHALTLRGPAEMPDGEFVWAARPSPNGTRVAAITGPQDRMAPTALVLIEPATGRREIHALVDESQGSPPAWIDSSHVVIVKRDRYDEVFLAVMEAATGRVTDRLRLRALEFATSGDGRTAAALGDGGVVVGPTAAVLATRRLPEAGPAMPATDRVAGGIGLSRDGRFLAAVVQDGDGGPWRLAIYRKDGSEWHAESRLLLAGTPGGAPTWLP